MLYSHIPHFDGNISSDAPTPQVREKMRLDLEVFQDEVPAPVKLRAKAPEILAPSTVQKTLHWGCSFVSDLDVLELTPF